MGVLGIAHPCYRKVHLDLWRRDAAAARRIIVLPSVAGLRTLIEARIRHRRTALSNAEETRQQQQRRVVVDQILERLNIPDARCIVWPVHS
jgi:hypothetical protein